MIMDSASAPQVSVMMPSFNQVEFIGIAVESVLSQSFTDLELIVADGGSSDGTVTLLEGLQKEDGRLRWFSEQDNGPASALNRALAKVRGGIVGWLNSDDVYTPGAIGRAVRTLVDDPELLMVYGHGQHIDVSGKVLNLYPTLPPDTPLDRFSDGCFICQPTVFFRRTMSILLGDFNESLRTAFDFDYWLRAFKYHQNRIGFVDEVQALSRLHGSCITKTMRREVALEGVYVLKRHIGHAPIHWILTHLEEMKELAISDPAAYVDELLMEVRADFSDKDLERVKRAAAGLFQ